jgi:hypothetical protein
MQQDYRLVGGLITQVTSLTVLWYMMCRKGRRWKDIGWKLEFADIPRATGLLIAAVVIMYLPVIPVQYFYRAYSGHFLAPNSLHSIFGFGISFLSIAFICLNPSFEEPIVRAYTMSEVMSLGGSRELAVNQRCCPDELSLIIRDWRVRWHGRSSSRRFQSTMYEPEESRR